MDNKSYNCDNCGKFYATLKSLKSHRKRQHGILPERPAPTHYACEECGKEFKNSEHFQMHKIVHKGDGPLEFRLKTVSTFKFDSENHSSPSSSAPLSPQIEENINIIEEVPSDIEIKEEPIEEGNHQELLFVREAHYDFTGALNEKDLPKPPGEILPQNVDLSTTTKHFVNESEEELENEDNGEPSLTSLIPKDENEIKSEVKRKRKSKRITVEETGCRICLKEFKTPKLLQSHLKCHNDARPYSCEECEKTFKHGSSLRNHKFLHQENGAEKRKKYKPAPGAYSGSFKCSLCPNVYTKKTTLEIHFRHHTGETPFVCEICPKGFINKKSLKEHLMRHNDERPFACTECPLRFIRNSNLKDHLKIHTGEKPFTCSICSKSFRRTEDLKIHNKSHQAIKDKTFLCDICSKTFGDRKSLSDHIWTHSDVKPYQCELCPKSFVRMFDLKEHMSVHYPSRKYECETCHKLYSTTKTLRKHKRIHLDLRPYGCDICSKKFRVSDHLKVHIRIHTGEKPFSCQYCPRSFRTSGDHRIHVRSHTGERPYTCDCGSSYVVGSQLKKHQKNTGHVNMVVDDKTIKEAEDLSAYLLEKQEEASTI